MSTKYSLFFIRHGIAEPEGSTAVDADRALTSEGRALLTACEAGFRSLIPSTSKICTSPYRRAVETAELLADCVRILPSTIIKLPSLSLQGDIDECAIDIEAEFQQSGGSSLAIVGHHPTLLSLVYLLCGKTFSDIERGGLIAITHEGKIGARTCTLSRKYSVEDLQKCRRGT